MAEIKRGLQRIKEGSLKNRQFATVIRAQFFEGLKSEDYDALKDLYICNYASFWLNNANLNKDRILERLHLFAKAVAALDEAKSMYDSSSLETVKNIREEIKNLRKLEETLINGEEIT